VLAGLILLVEVVHNLAVLEEAVPVLPLLRGQNFFHLLVESPSVLCVENLVLLCIVYFLSFEPHLFILVLVVVSMFKWHIGLCIPREFTLLVVAKLDLGQTDPTEALLNEVEASGDLSSIKDELTQLELLFDQVVCDGQQCEEGDLVEQLARLQEGESTCEFFFEAGLPD